MGRGLAIDLEVPDAFLVTSPRLARADGSPLVSRQERKRAEIFAETRRHIALFGHQGVTVRAVASACNTTSQTIFNQIGNRALLLGGSLVDQAQAFDALARTAPAYPAYPLAYADAIWHVAERHPRYLKNASAAWIDIDTATGKYVSRAAHRFIRDGINRSRVMLRAGCDSSQLSDALCSVIGAAVSEWARSEVDSAALRQALRSRIGFMLIGALGYRDRAALDDWDSMVPTGLREGAVKSATGKP